MQVTQLETFARAGYAARGVVYIMLGYLTLATGRAEGTTSVLDDLKALPAGGILLALTGVGLLGYAVFRLYGAAVDIEGNGSDAKGTARRIGHGASGVAHLLLGYLALQLAFGSGSGGDGGDPGRMAREAPGGLLLLVAAGIGFAAAALEQAVKAATASFMTALSADAPRVAEIAGRAGHAARAVVFAVLAWQLLRAGLGGGQERLGFEAALGALKDSGWIYLLVAAGLLLFGVFSLVMARYAAVRNEDLLVRAKAGAARFR